jgi:hypothetical protein
MQTASLAIADLCNTYKARMYFPDRIQAGRAIYVLLLWDDFYFDQVVFDDLFSHYLGVDDR